MVGGFGEITDTDDIGIGMFFGVGYLFFSLLSALVSLLIQAAVVRGALKITEGQRGSSSARSCRPSTSVRWCSASILLAIGTAIGLILCIVPGLILIFFSMFTYQFILDKGLPAFDAIKASFALVNQESRLGGRALLRLDPGLHRRRHSLWDRPDRRDPGDDHRHGVRLQLMTGQPVTP